MTTAGENNNLSFDPNENENTAKDLYESNTAVNANQRTKAVGKEN